MKIQKAEIVKIYPTEVWFEKDILGTIHVKLQHQGMEPFTFVQIHYDYAYTSNSHQWDFVKQVGKLLGVDDIQERQWVMPQSWIDAARKANDENT